MALTWRNVDAPSFGSSMYGTQQAVQGFSNAATGLSDALGNFGKAQTAQADQAAQMAALQIQDPNALRAALASGSLINGLNVDPTKLSAGTLASLQGRVGTLTDQAQTQANLDKFNYAFGRQQTQDQNTDAARQGMFDVLAAAGRGDTAGANAAVAANRDAFSRLSPEQQQTLLANGQSLVSGDQRNAATALTNTINARSDAAQQQGLALGQQIESAGMDNTRALAALQNIQDPNARQAAANYLQGRGYQTVSGPIGGTTPGAGTGAGTANTGLISGGGSIPAGIKTIGDYVDNKQAILGANKSTAVGPYQINADTWTDFAPKALGENWRSADLSDVSNHDKVANAIWDSTGGDASKIAGRWAVFQPGGALAGQLDSMKGLPWSQVSGRIAQAESGTDQQTLQTALNANNIRSQAQQLDSSARNAQNLQGIVNPKAWQAATADNRDPGTVIADAVEQAGVLKGADTNFLQKRVDAIQAAALARDPSGNTVPNAAQALEMLKSSVQAGSGGKIENWFDSRGLFRGASALPGGQGFNQDKLDTLLARYQNNAGTGDAIQAGQLAVSNQAIDGANQLYQAASAQVAAINARKLNGQKIDPATEAAANRQLQTAQGQLDAALRNAKGNQLNQPNMPPQAPQIPTPVAVAPAPSVNTEGRILAVPRIAAAAQQANRAGGGITGITVNPFPFATR